MQKRKRKTKYQKNTEDIKKRKINPSLRYLPRNKDVLQKIYDSMIDNKYLSAQSLAKICNVSIYMIYKIIRDLRAQNIGVLSTNNGYILSEYATKKDDAEHVVRQAGKFASVQIAMYSAEQDFKIRWNDPNERKLLFSIVTPITRKPLDIKKLQILQSKTNSWGI
jgi:hypothetical protein